MRLLTALTFILFIFSCTSIKHRSSKDDITAIHYIFKLPLVHGDGQYTHVGDTIPVYYYKDLVAYQLPYRFDSTKMTYHIKADSISNEHILTETRYNYFVYRQGSQYGLWYASIELLDSNKRLPVDSTLASKGTPKKLQSIIYGPNVSLVERVSMNNGVVFVDKYIPKIKPDESYSDTILLYYSKALKPIAFSFSPFLDSLMDAKLYKLRFAYNEAYSQQYAITLPKRDLIYEIEYKKVTNQDKLNALFQCFEQDEEGAH